MAHNFGCFCLLLFVSSSVAEQNKSDTPPESSTPSYDDSTVTNARSTRLPVPESLAPEETTMRTVSQSSSDIDSTNATLRSLGLINSTALTLTTNLLSLVLTSRESHSLATTPTRGTSNWLDDSSQTVETSSPPATPALHSSKPVTTKQSIFPTWPNLLSPEATTRSAATQTTSNAPNIDVSETTTSPREAISSNFETFNASTLSRMSSEVLHPQTSTMRAMPSTWSHFNSSEASKWRATSISTASDEFNSSSETDTTTTTTETRRPSFISLGGGGPNGRNGDCFRAFPQLAQRFTWEQLEFFCQQKRVFDEIVFGNETVTPFTDAQQRYLDQFKMDLNRTDDPEILAIRQEIRSLSEQDRRLFVYALRSLKKSQIDGVSKYDLIVMLSHPTLAPGAHGGAAFLPWHREYLRIWDHRLVPHVGFCLLLPVVPSGWQLWQYRFEAALLHEHPEVLGLPYWDSTLDSSLPEPQDSIVWHPSFFGNENGPVVKGPFALAEFILPNRTEPIPLTRNAGMAGALLTAADVTKFLSAPSFKHLTTCLDPWLEQTSHGVHQWVGGAMADIYYSAQDFVYFLHYAFIDKLWEQYRQTQTDTDRRYGYPANYEACTKFHFGHHPMRPFEPLRNIDGLSDAYSLYYRYVDSPAVACRINEDCSSKFLFCNHLNGSVCTSSVRLGGDCTGLTEYDPCFKGRCANDKCVALALQPTTGLTTASGNSSNSQLVVADNLLT